MTAMFKRSWYRYLTVALLSGVAAILATALIPPIEHEVGPADVSINATLGTGQTALEVAPLGTVDAATHLPPLNIEVALSRIDLQDFGETIAQGSQSELIDEIESGLRAAALQLGIRQLIGGALVGTVVAALVAGRRAWYMLTGAVAGIVFVGLGLLAASMSFDLDEFENASYTGALKYAPQVMEAVNRGPETLRDLNSRFATAASRLQELMALVAQPLPDPNEGTTAILHVSDIHSNPLGVQVARRLADDFGVDAVIDTGDLTSFGQRIEARIGRSLEQFPVPYLFVPGNHDSDFNRRELSDVEGVELLDKETFSVDAVDILGWPDPTFTASNETSTEEGNDERAREAPLVADAVEEMRPDVLATHDELLASGSVGLVPLVLAGHTHERSLEQEDGTLVLTVGSTGATGLGSFIVESDRPYEAEIVYFRGNRAVAVDYIQLSGLGGDFEVERRTFDTDEVEPVPSPSE
jgi:predicted phosphodiesterase